jgi:alanyl-tRNA synthetase
MVVGVSKDLTDKVRAGALVNMIAAQVGGKGGGSPDMAMAGGVDASGIPAAIASVKPWVHERL